MSMLAERKRKEKWSLNPRGKTWSQDANKFGQKILEKMGWQNGKGLGAKEDGITEHVKVSYKNDSKGMGYKETDQLTYHESNFSALLESLTGAEASLNLENVKLNSLEKKSEGSRKRVHYHKFTKGKDLSSRSEKDLANIFGKKTLKKVQKPVEKEEVKEEHETGSSVLINSGSMADYFKSKLPTFGKLSKDAESDSEGEMRVGFGFQNSMEEKPGLKRKLQMEEIVTNTFSPRKKIRSADNGLVNPAFDPLNNHVVVDKHNLETILEESVENDESSTGGHNGDLTESNITVESIVKPKRKKNKSKDTSEITYEFDNMNFSETTENSEIISEVNGYEVVLSSKKKKKMKNASKSTNSKDTDEQKENGQAEPEHVKKSKKKKSKVGLENPNFEDYSTNDARDSPEADQNEMGGKESKKRKQKKMKNGIENPNFEDNISEELDDSIAKGEEVQQPKKRKSKKIGIENPNFEDYVESEIQVNPALGETEKRSKKHKKKVENGIENPNFNDYSDTSLSIVELDNEIAEKATKSKKKKKNKSAENNSDNTEESFVSDVVKKLKSKKKKSVGGIDNITFDDQQDTPETTIEENPYEVKPKKKKKQTEASEQNVQISSDIVEDIELMLNVVNTPVVTTPKPEPKTENKNKPKRRKSVRFSDYAEEHIIPNNEQLKKMEGGIDNENFDKIGTRLEENLEKISNTMDRYEAEIENDINEKKDEIMIGEMDNLDGPNEKLPGGTRLKFKQVQFNSKRFDYFAASTGAKKSYKHLIKGDIIVKFNNTNLHEIDGYANKRKVKV